MPETAEEVEKAFVKAFKSTQNKLDIEPLDIDTTDKFQSTIHYNKWIQNYDHLEAPYVERDPKDRKQMLLINVGPAAAARFDLAPLETGEGDEYKNARATLEQIYCVSQPKNESRVRFFRIEPKGQETPIRFIERLRTATQLCEFDRPDEEIMRMMLSKCTHSKWQEKRIIQDWDHTKLKEGTKYARQLEEANSLHRELRKNETEGGRVNAVKTVTTYSKCNNCGTNHKEGSCLAKNKPCFKCNRLGHFRQYCRSPGRGRGRFRGRNFNNYGNRGRGGFSNRGRGRGTFRGSSYRGRGSYRGYRGRGNYQHYNQNFRNQVKSVNTLPATGYNGNPNGHANEGDSFNMSSFRTAVQELNYNE